MAEQLRSTLLNQQKNQVTAGSQVKLADGTYYTMKSASEGVTPLNSKPILANASSGTKVTTVSRGNPLTVAPTPTPPQEPPAPPAPTAEQLDQQDRLDQTAMVEQGMKDKNKLATEFGLSTEPDTIQGVVDKFKADKLEAKTRLQKELDRQKALDVAAGQKFDEQAAGSLGANNAAFAQGREGAMAGSAGALRSEFTTAINKSIQENKIRLEAAQAQRDQLMVDLDKAQQAGDASLIDSISKSLSSARAQIEQNKTNYMNALTQANEQSRLAEQSTRQNLDAFTKMVDTGAVMTPAGIIATAKTLSVPAEVALSYYDSAKEVREDKSLSNDEKATKLADLNYDFALKQQGYVTEQAKQIKGITDMIKTGKITEAEAGDLFQGLGIDNSRNPLTAVKNRLELANAAMKEYEAKWQGQTPPVGTKEYLEYKKAALELQIAEADNSEFTGQVPETQLKDIFAIPGKSRVTPSFADGHKQCGEAYNDLTEGKKVGDSYKSKMNIVTKRTDPAIGNALVLPLTEGGVLGAGHIETVIKANPITGEFTTVSYNRDGRGTQTIEHYTVQKLQEKYGTNWGFSNSKLKPAYAEKLKAAQPIQSTKGGEEYNKFYQQALDELDMKPSEAKKYAQQEAAKAIKERPAEMATLPDEYNWASTVIDNTFGGTEGGKAAERKQKQLADAIESGNGKSAKNIVYNAILEGVSSTERAAFDDAVTMSDSYNKLQTSLSEFEKAGLDTGLVGNSISEIYKKLTKERPAEAVRLKTRLEQSFNAYRKAITGAGASVGELEMLKESMPTFDKNLNEIKEMANLVQGDASNLLDRKVTSLSKGAFSNYKEMNDKLGQIERLGQATESEKKMKGFLDFGKSLISDNYAATGKYTLPEDHAINNFDF